MPFFSALQKNRSAIYLYVFLVIFSLIGCWYGNLLLPKHPNLRVWPISNVFLMLLGLPLALIQDKAGLPPLWPNRTFPKIHLFLPLLIGITFGVLDWIVIESIINKHQHTALPPYTQPFPYSIFLYGAGAFEVEVFYRLLPITLSCLFFKHFKNGKCANQAFWTIALLTALREPLEQWPSGPEWYVVYALLTGFGMNLVQAIYLRYHGFWTSLLIRLGHYLIWHILNGILIEAALHSSGR